MHQASCPLFSAVAQPGYVAQQRTSGNVWNIRHIFHGPASGVLLASSGKRPEVPTTLQCPGRSHTNCLVQKVSSAEVEKPCCIESVLERAERVAGPVVQLREEPCRVEPLQEWLRQSCRACTVGVLKVGDGNGLSPPSLFCARLGLISTLQVSLCDLHSDTKR